MSNDTTLLSPVCYFQANKKGQCLRGQAKQIVLNVYSRIREENSSLTKEEAVARTASLTGVSAASIFASKKEWRSSGGLLRTPGKKRSSKRKRSTMKCDDFVRTAIRGKVHQFLFENQPPTINSVLQEVQKDPDLPNISRATLHRVLKEIGFLFDRRNRNSNLQERSDIIAWRHRYLRAIRQYRREGRKIFYQDETWANAGHTVSKRWRDTTVETSRDAHLRGLSTGLKDPSGRGARLICAHAGNEDGFVDGALLLFSSKGKGDYHKDMNGKCFEEWFEKLLSLLPPASVIVIDNASYHSLRSENVPTTSWKKDDIRNWLTAKGIAWEPEQLKPELVEIVKREKHKFINYRVDDMARYAGHTILRLPPYHAELNPIELAWSQVKGYVARNNKTFKLADVYSLMEEGIEKVSSTMWSSFVEHVKKVEDHFWEQDLRADESTVLIINMDTSESEESDSSLSGIEEFSEDEP